MEFETVGEVLKWYERQERVLTPEFLSQIPWNEIKNHPISAHFFPVLTYMRNVEKLTEVYYHQMMRSPTGNDPDIRRFMDRWLTEEDTHGETLNRFLGEAGQPYEDKWFEKVKKSIPSGYHFRQKFIHPLTKLFGENFSAVHMTWGAVNEYSTLGGYQRLWQLAEHPVLEKILRAIAKEESAHSYFYWSVARIRLKSSPFRQKLTNYLIENFWRPVGQGLCRAESTAGVVRALFSGSEGLEVFSSKVNQRLKQLPGQAASLAVMRRIEKISQRVCTSS